MTRTYYSFDKQPKTKDLALRLHLIICSAPDCGRVLHRGRRRGGQAPGTVLWCSEACRMRIRNRELRQITLAKHRGIRKRHKGILGTGHVFFGA
jgi:hypothetical protein